MPMPAKNLNGLTFGYLTVLQREGSSNRKATWKLKCVCGNEVIRQGVSLTADRGRSTKHSCGCKHGEKLLRHGMTGSRPHRIWSNMKSRCSNPSDKDYKNYGERGIRVCKRWERSFENFWADMCETYSDGLTLDRRDNNRGYSKRNCRWATAKEQGNNTRCSRWLDTPAGRMTAAQAADHYGIKRVTLYARLTRYNWPLLKALGLTTF